MTVFEFLCKFLDPNLSKPDTYNAVLTIVGVDPDMQMDELVMLQQLRKDRER